MKICNIDNLEDRFLSGMLSIADSAYLTVTNDLKDNCLNIGREDFSKIEGSIVVHSKTGLEFFDIIFPLDDSSRELIIKYIDKNISNWGLIHNDFRFLVVMDKNDLSLVLDESLIDNPLFKGIEKEDIDIAKVPANNYKSLNYYKNNSSEILYKNILNIESMEKLELTPSQINEMIKTNPRYKKIIKKNKSLSIFLIIIGLISLFSNKSLWIYTFLVISILANIKNILRTRKIVRSILPRRKYIIIKKEE